MDSSQASPLASIVRKLQQWAPLSAADREAVLALPFTIRSLKAGHYVVWEGDRPHHTCLLLQGFAYRQKTVGNGGKQIFSLHMDGDLIDLQNSLLGRADHNVQMLTEGDVALVPVDAIRRIAFDHPAVGMAMWYETLVEGSIFREWIANIGRRSALTRIAHLLCELALRLESVGLGRLDGYTLPMSQEWIADAVSLTPVHVNRVLKQLEKAELVVRTRRLITIKNWNQLALAGDFNPEYLHLKPANN